MATRQDLFQPTTHPAGVTPYEGNVPNNWRGRYFYAEVITTQADPATQIALRLFLDRNDGQGFQPWGGCTTNGGQHFAKDGVTPRNPSFNGTFPDQTGVRYRLEVELSQQDEVGLSYLVDPLN